MTPICVPFLTIAVSSGLAGLQGWRPQGCPRALWLRGGPRWSLLSLGMKRRPAFPGPVSHRLPPWAQVVRRGPCESPWPRGAGLRCQPPRDRAGRALHPCPRGQFADGGNVWALGPPCSSQRRPGSPGSARCGHGSESQRQAAKARAAVAPGQERRNSLKIHALGKGGGKHRGSGASARGWSENTGPVGTRRGPCGFHRSRAASFGLYHVSRHLDDYF